MAGKYYWLKLKRDFFKQPEIVIIERGKRGKEILLFYLKLLTEGIESEGRLRLTEKIPYSEADLAMITNSTPSLTKLALESLKGCGLLEVEEDGTLILPRIGEMTGSETKFAEQKRKQRQKNCSEMFEIETLSKNVHQSKRKSIEKEKEKEKESEQETEEDCGEAAVFVDRGQAWNVPPQDQAVQLTMEQQRMLTDQMGIDKLVYYLEKMDQFTALKRKKIKDPYQTILKWYEEDCMA